MNRSRARPGGAQDPEEPRRRSRRLAALAPVLLIAACSVTERRAVAPGRTEPGAGATPLDLYVHAPDPASSVERVGRIEGDGWEAHVLKLTSQTWLTPEEVDRAAWWHWLTIVEPGRVRSDIALLHIGGGGNDDPPPDRVDPFLARIAVSTGSVVAHLQMVPNQPLLFNGNGSGPRKEDRLIAFGWDRFLRSGDPRWLPRLPMTKSALRAMDAVTAFLADRGTTPRIERFVVTGASKRGWTAWLAAATDHRVVAVVPMVIDLLNLEDSFRHHFRAYGFWAPAIQSYVEMRIPEWFGTPQMRRLRAIVDPYEYRSRLTMPKLLINATGDQFFLPDSFRFYFDDLPGEKHLRYVPNADHSLNETDARETVLSFFRTIVTGAPPPRYSWTFGPEGSIQVGTQGPLFPSDVVLWQATNPKARDFRIESVGKIWTSTVLQGRDGVYVGRVATPDSGWTAFFVELTFPGAGREPLKLTTGVRVVPDTLPFTFQGN
jgi:PhoPQ-activated pathogenicity-related protein